MQREATTAGAGKAIYLEHTPQQVGPRVPSGCQPISIPPILSVHEGIVTRGTYPGIPNITM